MSLPRVSKDAVHQVRTPENLPFCLVTAAGGDNEVHDVSTTASLYMVSFSLAHLWFSHLDQTQSESEMQCLNSKQNIHTFWSFSFNFICANVLIACMHEHHVGAPYQHGSEVGVRYPGTRVIDGGEPPSRC